MTPRSSVAIRRVARLGSGHTPSRQHPEYWEDCTIPWFTLADVGQLRDGTKSVVNTTSEMISEVGLAHSAAELHPAGTVILSRTASVGFTAILGQDMATSQDFATWTCGPLILPRFLLYSLRSQPQEIEARKTGSTHKTIYMPDIETLRTPLPSLHEQERIADYLDRETSEIDTIVEKKRRMTELLVERRRHHISLAIWQGEYARTRLKHLTGRPTSGNRDHGSFSPTDEGIPCLRGLNVRPGLIERGNLLFISNEDNQRHCPTILQSGDVVIVRSGLAGSAALIPDDLDGCNCVDLVIVRRTRRLIPRFLEYVLNSREAQEQVTRGTSGALLTHFNADDCAELVIPYRDIAEQRHIVTKLDNAGVHGALSPHRGQL
jgi:type I restriction enzyme S subunit